MTYASALSHHEMDDMDMDCCAKPTEDNSCCAKHDDSNHQDCQDQDCGCALAFSSSVFAVPNQKITLISLITKKEFAWVVSEPQGPYFPIWTPPDKA